MRAGYWEIVAIPEPSHTHGNHFGHVDAQSKRRLWSAKIFSNYCLHLEPGYKIKLRKIEVSTSSSHEKN